MHDKFNILHNNLDQFWLSKERIPRKGSRILNYITLSNIDKLSIKNHAVIFQ